MASLCSVTSSKKILQSYRRRRHDDRPFARSQKVILPIRGFKGNRVLYGDSLDDACDVTDEDDDDDDDDEEEEEEEVAGEPVYSEPQFDESHLSSSDITVSSGYFSHETSPGLPPPHHNNNDNNNNTNNHSVRATGGLQQSLSSPESGYLSSDEDCLVFQTGRAL